MEYLQIKIFIRKTNLLMNYNEIYVVQLPYLNIVKKFSIKSDEYKNKLYALLKIFD